MLRSKSHRPWQPHVSDGQLLNPSAHTTESAPSFSDGIEEVEREVHEPPESDSASASGSSRVSVEIEPPPVTPERRQGKSRWYASLIERFTRH